MIGASLSFFYVQRLYDQIMCTISKNSFLLLVKKKKKDNVMYLYLMSCIYT